MRYVVLAILVVVSVACSSTLDPVPQSPDIDIQYVDREVACYIFIDIVPQSVLFDYPAHPGENASDESRIEWSKEVRRVFKLREVSKDSEIEALRYQIDEYNKLVPKCSALPPL